MFRSPYAYLFMTGVAFSVGLLLGLLLQLPSVSSPRDKRSVGEGSLGGDEQPGFPGVAARLLLETDDTQRQLNKLIGNAQIPDSRPIMGNANEVEINSLQANRNERKPAEFIQEGINSGRKEDIKDLDVKPSQLDQIYYKHNTQQSQDYSIQRGGNPSVKQTKGEIYETAPAFVKGQTGIYLVDSQQKSTSFAGRDPDSAKNEYRHTTNIMKRSKDVPGSPKLSRTEKLDRPAVKSKLADSLPNLSNINSDSSAVYSNPSRITNDLGGNASNNTLRSQINNATFKTKMADIISLQSFRLSDIVSGVYWTSQIDVLTPRGFSDEDVHRWRKAADKAKIVNMEEGCGRMQNRKLVFSDNSKACARYRVNIDQIQGDIYSFYLSRVLDINYVPPSVLILANSLDSKWVSVHQELASANWQPRRPAVFTPWLEDLTPAYIPVQLRGDDRQLHPVQRTFQNATLAQITDLVQWSDLIIFDYLTANLDRVVNNMFNKQWNPDMMSAPAHNLEKSTRTDSLVFLDNESGLFHSYRLIDKYSIFHETLLKSVCIFRKRTSENIKKFHRNKNIGPAIMELFREQETLSANVPKIPEGNIRILQKRVDDVYRQIEQCENQYGG